MKKEIYMETQRLILRDHRMEDMESHHELLSNQEDMYYVPEVRTNSREESEADLITAVKEAASEERKAYFFRIEERGSGELVGEIGYTVLEETPVGKLVHLGYFSRRKFWGQGYMTEALQRLLKFAFEENNVFRLTTGCLKENPGSEKVMIKCGLVKEADMKQKVWHDGKMKDRVEYRLLREEYWKLPISGVAERKDL